MGEDLTVKLYSDYLATKALLDTVRPRCELAQTFMLHYTNIVETDRHLTFARQMDRAVQDVKITAITGILSLGVGFALSAVRSLGATAHSLARTRELIARMPPPTGVVSSVMQWAIRTPSLGPLQGIIGPSVLTGQSGAFIYHRVLNAMSLMAGATAGAAMGGTWSRLGAAEVRDVFAAAERACESVFMHMDPAIRTLLQLTDPEVFAIDTALQQSIAGELRKRYPEVEAEQLRVLTARTMQVVWLDMYRKLEQHRIGLFCEEAGLLRKLASATPASGGRTLSPGPSPTAY
ncbi:MAG: hypothetical protein IPN03_01015 [Holophagales bacterium]|nr:hypothetical protein [Holophagales bacterium]